MEERKLEPRIIVYADAGLEPDLHVILRLGRETLSRALIKERDIIFADPREMHEPIRDAILKISKESGETPTLIARLLAEGDEYGMIRRYMDRNYALMKERKKSEPPEESKPKPPVVEDEEPKSFWESLGDALGEALLRSTDPPIPKARVVKGGEG